MLKRVFAVTPKPKRLPLAGIVAGAFGGFMSAFVKLGWEVPFPPRAPGRIPEPQVLVTMFTHTATSGNMSLVIHFLFSIVFGALYGAMVEFFPVVAIGMGTIYGLAVWIGAHEIVMPWMGLSPPTWRLPWTEQFSEFFGHAVWGFAIEIFRRDLRRRITGQLPLSIPTFAAEAPIVFGTRAVSDT
jgi:putative membrane protein